VGLLSSDDRLTDALRAMEETLISTEQCEVLLHREVGYLIADWKAYATSEQFRKIHEQLLEEVKRHRIRLILGNALNLVQIAAAEQQWILQDFYPRLIHAGVRADAVVRSKHYFSQVAIDSIHQHGDKVVAVQYFDNRDDA
jgi:hypothetical protein